MNPFDSGIRRIPGPRTTSMCLLNREKKGKKKKKQNGQPTYGSKSLYLHKCLETIQYGSGHLHLRLILPNKRINLRDPVISPWRDLLNVPDCWIGTPSRGLLSGHGGPPSRKQALLYPEVGRVYTPQRARTKIYGAYRAARIGKTSCLICWGHC